MLLTSDSVWCFLSFCIIRIYESGNQEVEARMNPLNITYILAKILLFPSYPHDFGLLTP